MIRIKKKVRAPFVSDKDVCAILYMDRGLRARVGELVFGDGSGDGMITVLRPMLEFYAPEKTVEFRWLTPAGVPGPSVWAKPTTIGGWAEAMRWRGLTAAERKEETERRAR